MQSIAQTVLVGSVPSRPEAAKEFLPNFKDYFQAILWHFVFYQPSTFFRCSVNDSAVIS